MRVLKSQFVIINYLSICITFIAAINDTRDHYHEDLFIKPLQDGKVFAQFEFTTLYRGDIADLRWENKIEILPLSISDLVATTDIEELRFSLTKGNWNYPNWGYSTRPSPPGAQIIAKFQRSDINTSRSWKKLINSLAGKFCASLVSENFEVLAASKLAYGNLYANLPEENVCTGNLTPWKKLLPCYTSSGLGSLLNAVNLLKSSYISMSIEIKPTLLGDGTGRQRVKLSQSISIVFNPLNLFEGKQTWSLIKLFGGSVNRVCPVADHSRVYVETTSISDLSNLSPSTGYYVHDIALTTGVKSLGERRFAIFDIDSILRDQEASQKQARVDIGIKQSQLFKRPSSSSRSTLPIKFSTHIAGTGASDGAIIATITNNHHEHVRVTYMDVVPHFLRIYLHTLSIITNLGQELKPDKLNYVLAQEKSPTVIELSVVIPAHTKARISYAFERAFLRWTEFKADANKGVLLGSASLLIELPATLSHLIIPTKALVSNSTHLDCTVDDEGDVMRIYARPLLIILPTPDFSMPYNVICLVCTVMVAAFGPIHSMTTRRSTIKVNKATLGAG